MLFNVICIARESEELDKNNRLPPGVHALNAHFLGTGDIATMGLDVGSG